MTDKWEAKLADFNLSRALREGEAAAQLSQLINSPEWSAPERLAGQMYGKAADVFSFGVILYGARSAQPPLWKDASQLEQLLYLDLEAAVSWPGVPYTIQ